MPLQQQPRSIADADQVTTEIESAQRLTMYPMVGHEESDWPIFGLETKTKLLSSSGLMKNRQTCQRLHSRFYRLCEPLLRWML